MRIGLALPHYDFSVPGPGPLTFEALGDHARRAEQLGYDSLWVSDHLALSIEKYGGGAGMHFAYEPLTTLAALSRLVSAPRLGTLVLNWGLRPPAVAAKTLATLDRICGGRLDVGVGAGWYPPDFEAVGRRMPSPAERLAGLEELIGVLADLLGGGAGKEVNQPPALQSPRPRIIVGGKGDRVLRLAGRRADGWNTAWVWTPDDWVERAGVVEAACTAAGRDPRALWRSVGLYALAGEDEGDLARRYRRMQDWAPNRMLAGVSLDQWRAGRLVGTITEVGAQASRWAELGVDELIVCPGPLPFSVGCSDDVGALAAALGLRGTL